MSQREWLKLGLLITGILSVGFILWKSPILHMPLFLSGVTTLLLSPLVRTLQRMGFTKPVSIVVLFVVVGVTLTWATVNLSQTLIQQWDELSRDTPRYIEQTTQRLATFENDLLDKYPWIESVLPHRAKSASASTIDTVIGFGKQTALWGINNIPSIVGDVLTWLFLVPIFVFIFLKDGDRIRKRMFQLVPNPYFESTFMVLTQIVDSTSDYLRAKAVEALMVGLLTTLGLWIVGAPYPLILGAIAGVTNIIPYLGPILGAAPGVILAFADPAFAAFLWPSVFVYIAVNAIDTVVIFPIFVGKIVDLHPVTLIIVVMLGQQFYGIIGMLLSVPVASAVKIFVREIYAIIYDPIR